MGALQACCRKVRARLTLAAIIERLDDGRPGIEEAWALLAPLLSDEGATIVWTDEMAEAYGIAVRLADDAVAAHLAFKEKYERLVSEARLSHRPVHWSASLGWEQEQRWEIVFQAYTLGRVSLEYVRNVCREYASTTGEIQKLIEQVMHGLPTVPPANRDAGQ